MHGLRLLQVAVLVACCGVAALPVAAAETPPIPEARASLAPIGVELSDEQLLAVDGELDPLTVAASMIVWGGVGAIGDLAGQLYSGDGVDWAEVGLSFGVGAVGGYAKLAAVPFVRAGLATALRWNAIAGAAIQRGFTTAVRTTGNVVYSAARATSNAFSAAWNWINQRLP